MMSNDDCCHTLDEVDAFDKQDHQPQFSDYVRRKFPNRQNLYHNKSNVIVKPPYLIHPFERWKFWWDIGIMMFAVFNSFTIPLTLSFPDINKLIEENVFYMILVYASTLFFIVDIVLQANTAYF